MTIETRLNSLLLWLLPAWLFSDVLCRYQDPTVDSLEVASLSEQDKREAFKNMGSATGKNSSRFLSHTSTVRQLTRHLIENSTKNYCRVSMMINGNMYLFT